MQLLVLILNRVELLEDLLSSLADYGLKGATVIDSTGMARLLSGSKNQRFLNTLKMLLDPDLEENKTVLMAVKDGQVEDVKQIVHTVTGGLHKPDTGILFGLPITFIEGLGE